MIYVGFANATELPVLILFLYLTREGLEKVALALGAKRTYAEGMIRLIVAIDRKRGLAKKGYQPWYLPQDERYFTEKTKSFGGENLIGSTTFKTFQGPLPDRKNYVLTRDDTPIQGVELIHDIDKFLNKYKEKDLWVVGGSNVFQQVIDAGCAYELYITHIDADFGCDQFFPEYENLFKLAHQSDWHEENGFRFNYSVYTGK